MQTLMNFTKSQGFYFRTAMKSDERLSLKTQTLKCKLRINNARIMNALDDGMQVSTVKLI